MYKAISNLSCNSNFRVRVPALMILCSCLLLSITAQAAELVGALKFARGNVTIESEAGKTRKASKDDELMQNELVVTGTDGIAVIQLNDDSRMTLRPSSSFRVSQLDKDNDSSNQSAVLNLLRGGLRLITGLIGKENPAGYRLNTPVATIGIRGTEFSTRICGSECAAEEKQLAGSDAAKKIKEGLYVTVDDGGIYLQNFAVGGPLELGEGESGYVPDLYSLPVKLSLVPAFQAIDKVPSPGQLDIDDVEIPDGELGVNQNAAAAAAAATVVATGTASETKAAEADISGVYEIDEISYSRQLPHADRKWFFGSVPDIEFTLTQKGDKIKGEFDGDREGTIKGKVDDEEVIFEFLLEAKGGEIKDGAGTWIVQGDGSLKGDFKIRDQKRGVVRGTWVLTKID